MGNTHVHNKFITTFVSKMVPNRIFSKIFEYKSTKFILIILTIYLLSLLVAIPNFCPSNYQCKTSKHRIQMGYTYLIFT